MFYWVLSSSYNGRPPQTWHMPRITKLLEIGLSAVLKLPRV
jgi:hypothetical protein